MNQNYAVLYTHHTTSIPQSIISTQVTVTIIYTMKYKGSGLAFATEKHYVNYVTVSSHAYPGTCVGPKT